MFDKVFEALDCRQSCFEMVEFNGNIQSGPHGAYGADVAVLTIYFESMTEQVNEELLLFDLPSFVGNIGGSLGLFIGFSYLDFATKITNGLVDMISRKKSNLKNSA